MNNLSRRKFIKSGAILTSAAIIGSDILRSANAVPPNIEPISASGTVLHKWNTDPRYTYRDGLPYGVWADFV